MIGVVATVFAAAVLVVLLLGGFLGGQPNGPTPSVRLEPPSRFGSILYISVASAEPRAPLADFRAVLEVEYASVRLYDYGDFFLVRESTGGYA